jgi:hypothetical protein
MPKAPEVIATGSSIDARYRAAGLRHEFERSCVWR